MQPVISTYSVLDLQMIESLRPAALGCSLCGQTLWTGRQMTRHAAFGDLTTTIGTTSASLLASRHRLTSFMIAGLSRALRLLLDPLAK